jgi:hypothetical protein
MNESKTTVSVDPKNSRITLFIKFERTPERWPTYSSIFSFGNYIAESPAANCGSKSTDS